MSQTGGKLKHSDISLLGRCNSFNTLGKTHKEFISSQQSMTIKLASTIRTVNEYQQGAG